MYSTRRIHKSAVDGNAYCTIGDPYKGDRPALPERWKGKKMVCLSYPQNAGDGMFARVTYASEPYAEMERFIKTQPLDARKKGFGTKDASRRGEFTSFTRTEQYRETLRKEQHIVNKFRNKDEEERITKKFKEIEDAKPKTFLYDIGRSKVTTFDPRDRRDRHFKFDGKKEVDLGPYRLASRDVGDNGNAWSWKLTKPQFGPIAYVKNFYDKSHLEVPGF